jgi:hypothetical protein
LKAGREGGREEAEGCDTATGGKAVQLIVLQRSLYPLPPALQPFYPPPPDWLSMQAADRLLLVGEPLGPGGPAAAAAGTHPSGVDAPGLTMRHVPLPTAYLATAWPLRHVAASPCGRFVAAAGAVGAAVYSVATESWRLFGDVTQVLNCTALYCTLLYCTAPYCTVLY